MITDHSNIDLDEDVVTEKCSVMPECTDILCLRCGWEGHVEADETVEKIFNFHIDQGI